GATQFKCAPPIRERANQERLWGGLEAGTLDLIVSDHSPCTPALKRLETGDFGQAWGGIAGLQFSLPAIWTKIRERGLGMERLVHWMCEAPAELAGLSSRKGGIAVGMDADLVAIDPDGRVSAEPSRVQHRHSLTPYSTRSYTGAVQSTWVRGVRVFDGRGGAMEFPGAAQGERVFRKGFREGN
ncbi:MAG TPA: amidohydrolase family protein, partial [Bdellovibrionota bacterium]|nr:amidohydrolase family protein [Bdellovibrionota bacterium]